MRSRSSSTARSKSFRGCRHTSHTMQPRRHTSRACSHVHLACVQPRAWCGIPTCTGNGSRLSARASAHLKFGTLARNTRVDHYGAVYEPRPRIERCSTDALVQSSSLWLIIAALLQESMATKAEELHARHLDCITALKDECARRSARCPPHLARCMRTGACRLARTHAHHPRARDARTHTHARTHCHMGTAYVGLATACASGGRDGWTGSSRRCKHTRVRACTSTVSTRMRARAYTPAIIL
jgi:hypothetical protein